MARPDFVEDEHLIFLDDLRDSGVTNMFGAVSHIQEEFFIEEKEARKILCYWMDTFGEDDR